ncbi:MAG: hypothetical protein ACXAD7_25550 [Candidatus Kariarchaeaceae archaeon]|jgi:hypothetical protein
MVDPREWKQIQSILSLIDEYKVTSPHQASEEELSEYLDKVIQMRFLGPILSFTTTLPSSRFPFLADPKHEAIFFEKDWEGKKTIRNAPLLCRDALYYLGEEEIVLPIA